MCVSQADLSYVARDAARPGSSVRLQVRTGTEALVALSATDTALQALRSTRVNPMAKVRPANPARLRCTQKSN